MILSLGKTQDESNEFCLEKVYTGKHLVTDACLAARLLGYRHARTAIRIDNFDDKGRIIIAPLDIVAKNN